MNFVFVSPHFPKSYWNFCDRLKKNGVNVLGLADVPYDDLSWELKNCLTEYYKVNNLEDYDEVVRAIGYFTHKYGKIDWIESNNEYWLELDAKVRRDFNISTGMKAEVIFGTSNEFPPSIMDIVNTKDHLAYHTVKDVSPILRDCGERVLKAFNARNRFFHLEFFRLTKAKEGLGEVGDIVALEVNMRAPGGYTPDMINYANSVDIYQIWADMVAFGKTYVDLNKQHYYAAYCARRDGKQYLHSEEEIWARYGDRLVMRERMPEILSGAMGNEMYTAKLDTKEELDEYNEFVLSLV